MLKNIKEIFFFLYSEFVGVGKTTRRNTYWNNFLKPLNLYVYSSLPPVCYLKEEGFTYNELPKIEKDNICLFGYFQSYKYFQDNFNLINNLLNLKSQKNTVITKSELSKEELAKSVSIHFRIGDYKLIQDVYPLLRYEYYENSILFLNEKKINNNKYSFNKVLYFCEEKDIEHVNIIINKLKINFHKLEFIKVSEKLEDWEQLLLMSCCKYNIIANSTFSLWAAYFNENENKIVCYPEKWFGEKKSNVDTKDLFLPEWNKIKI
jgi:hypothetical protein